MALRIRQSPEPLSVASFDVDVESLAIGSDASRLLIEELQRYCRREITGRSFLISGHRGAGKTTLVASAVLEVWKKAERSGSRMRPLFVPLHGPSLFREVETGEAKSEPASDPASKQALEQTILCLHRAVVREASSSYRRRVGDSRERQELAAQLAVELYECPGPARLREMWQRGGFLERGVLFRDADEGQGMRELVAVAGACEAFRRISGIYKLEEKNQEEAREKVEASVGTEAGKDLFTPLASLLTGGLVGAGVLAAGTSGIGATVAGILGALGASTVFKASASRSREQSASRELTFLFDLTVSTLDRALPILIERLQDAGLAPVFVVDELDKVEDLSDRILGMVHYLKKLVAEHAFFCFLTDRNYFEEMTRRGEDHPYPVEYTYFMHRLFVSYQPRDFHAYLDEVLGLKDASLNPEDRTDGVFLRYVLLHQAQMHALDLHRRLSALRGVDGTVTLAGIALRDRPAFKVAVVMQLAVEMVLRAPDLVDRVERQPEFGRLLLDSLYYPLRRWQERPESGLSLEEDQEAGFGAYLEGRMGREQNGGPQRSTVSGRDRRLLFSYVRRLADLLSDRRSYLAAFRAWNEALEQGRQELLDTSLLDALPPDGPPLLLRRGSSQAYRWLVDANSLDLLETVASTPPAAVSKKRPRTGASKLPGSDWKPSLEFIDGFAKVLADVSGGKVDLPILSSHLRVLGTSPGWPTVQNARAGLERSEFLKEFPETTLAAIRCVQEYALLLEKSASTVADALVCGLAIGMAAPAGEVGERMLAGLRILSETYRFATKTDAEVEQVLGRTMKAIRESFPKLVLSHTRGEASVRERFAEWAGDLDRSLVSVVNGVPFLKDRLAFLHAEAWEACLRRMDLHFQGARRPEPELSDLFALAAEAPAARLFKLDLREMTLVDWSAALAEVVSSTAHPLWAAVAALLTLGFRSGWCEMVLNEVSKLWPDPASRSKAAWDRFFAWRRFLSGGPDRCALLVKRAGPSIVDAWQPHPAIAVVTMTSEEALALVSSLRNWRGTEGPRFDRIAFEMPIEPPDLDRRVLEFLQEAVSPREQSVVYLYPQRPQSAPLTPFVIAPKGLEELFPATPPPA